MTDHPFGTKKIMSGLPAFDNTHTLRSASFKINESTVLTDSKPICSDGDLIRLRKYSILIDELRDAYEDRAFETLSVSVKIQSLLKDLLFAEDSPAGTKGWPRNFLSPMSKDIRYEN